MGDSLPIPAADPPEATNPFTMGFFGAVDEEEDEMPPFVLPADVGVEVESPPPVEDDYHVQLSGSGLSVVLEDEGGIKFTFEIPSARKPVPFCEAPTEDDDDTFTFPAASLVSRKSASPPSPSAIPRASVLERFEGRDAKLSLSYLLALPIEEIRALRSTPGINSHS